MKTPKNKKIVVAVLVALLATLYGGYFLVKRYEENKEYKEFVKYMEEYKNDTYGGKTPEETLRMFIDAVEAGDYELASKYFTVEKRKGELDTLQKTSQNNNIDFLLGYLYQTMNSGGYFSTDGKIYTIKNPVFIEFILYPSGIWKINEI